MKRTQMYFDDAAWARIKAQAEASGRSAASVVRDAVTAYFAGEQTQPPARTATGLLGVVAAPKIAWKQARRQAWQKRAARVARSSATRTSSSAS